MNPLKRVSKTGQTVKNKRKNTTGIAARIIALLHNRSEKAERHDSAQAQNHLTVCNRSRPAASLFTGSSPGHVKPTVSAQHLTSHLISTNPAPHLHWLVGSFSTHVGGAGGGIGGGEGEADGGGGEGETQHAVAALHMVGTSGVQHSLTVAVSCANFLPAGQVQ